MNDSIKKEGPHSAPAWPLTFVVLSLILLMMVLMEAYHVRPFDLFAVSFIPAIEAAGETLRQSIAEFAGRPPVMVPAEKFVSLFISLCLTLVIGPALYIKLRERAAAPKEQPRRRWADITGTAIAGAWSVLVATVLLGTYSASYRVYPQMTTDAELSHYANTMTDLVAEASFRYRQFAALPKAFGGGAGTFRGPHGIVSFEELGLRSSSDEGRFILVPQRNDTTVMLLFIGNRSFPSDTWMKSASGRTLIYESFITPASHRITAVR